MQSFGIFEIKTKLSQICERVAATGESVLVTKRGKPFVRIDPIYPSGDSPSRVWEARERFEKHYSVTDELETSRPQTDSVYNPFTEEDA